MSIGFYVRQRRKVPPTPRKYRDVRPASRPPTIMVLVAFSFGLSFGLMKGLMEPVESSWIFPCDLLNIAAIVGAAAAFYVTGIVCKMDFDHLTYQVALPLIAAGFLCLPLHEPFSIIGMAVHQFGYQCFSIVLWPSGRSSWRGSRF